MGVKFDRILDGFDGPFEKIAGRRPAPPGRVDGRADRRRAICSAISVNDAFIAVNRLLKAGEDVYWLKTPVTRERQDLSGRHDVRHRRKASTLPIAAEARDATRA